MASLESLSNPLERLATLPTVCSLRKNPDDTSPDYNSPNWDATVQYYSNDIVISPENGGAYIFTGGALNKVAVRGGVDPSQSDEWTKLTQTGVQEYESSLPGFADAGGGNYTVTSANLTDAGAGSVWRWDLQGVFTSAGGALVAADVVQVTVTPSPAGAGSAGQIVQILPRVGQTSTAFSTGGIVFSQTAAAAPPATNDFLVTASYANANAQTFVGRITWTRWA